MSVIMLDCWITSTVNPASRHSAPPTPLRIDVPEQVGSPELTGEHNRFPIRLELRTQAPSHSGRGRFFYHLFPFLSLTFITNYDKFRPAEGNSYSPQITIPPTAFNHKSRPALDTHFNYTTEYGKSFDYNDQEKGGRLYKRK